MPTLPLKPKREDLLRHIEELEKELHSANFARRIIASLDDGIPLSDNGRREYLARIAVFYTDIFKKQLACMVADQQAEVSKFGWTDRETDFLRANINVMNLIDEWFHKCVGEHIGEVEEARKNERTEEEDAAINRLKDVI